VLYVPDIGVNLISIGTVTALGAKVVYSGCDVTFSRNGIIDITGQRIEDGVYKLHLKAKPIETDQALVSKIVGVPLSVWHARFAHVNMKTIQKMEQLQLVDDSQSPTTTPHASAKAVYMVKCVDPLSLKAKEKHVKLVNSS
jgi:hypothetical protein